MNTAGVLLWCSMSENIQLCLTLFSLALFKGIVDVDEGEVISFWVLELPVTLHCLVGHARRRLQEAA